MNLFIFLVPMGVGLYVILNADGDKNVLFMGMAIQGLGLLILAIHLATTRIVEAITAANNPSKPGDDPDATQDENTSSKES